MFSGLNFYEKRRLTNVLRDTFPRVVTFSKDISIAVGSISDHFVILTRNLQKFPDIVFSNKSANDDIKFVLTQSYKHKTWTIERICKNGQSITEAK